MAVISERILNEQIKSGILSRVYFLYGSEQFVKDRCFSRLCAAASGNSKNSFCYAVFDEKSFDADKLNDFISMLPFGADRKCAVVSDVDFSSCSKADAEKLTDIIKNVPDFSTLIFYYNAVVPGKRGGDKNRFSEIIKACSEYGETVEFKPMDESGTAAYLVKYAAKHGGNMSISAARYLTETCGTDLMQLVNETEKLCMLNPGSEITKRDIDLICTRSLESNAFKITDAISAGSADRALAVISDLFAAKTAPEQILGAISANFINIYRGKVFSSSKKSTAEFCKNAGISSDRALFMFRKNSEKYEMPQIRKCIRILEDADYSLKSRGFSEEKKRVLIEETVVKLIKSAVI